MMQQLDPQDRAVWPVSAWQESSPGEQGMDAALLALAYDDLAVKMPTIQALAVIRHGYLVFERHNARPRPDPAPAALQGLLSAEGKASHAPPLPFCGSLDGLWNICSVAKSVISTLTGITLSTCFSSEAKSGIALIPR